MTVDNKALPQELIDGLLANYRKPEDLIGAHFTYRQLQPVVVRCGVGSCGARRRHGPGVLQ